MCKPLVLLVEDDPNQSRLYTDELLEEGYQVEVVSSGEEAIEFVKRSPPDVVVADIHMPQMDGVEALHRLLDLNRSLPVILHTAYPSYRSDLRTWSAARFVTKDTGLDGLKHALRQVLEELAGD